MHVGDTTKAGTRVSAGLGIVDPGGFEPPTFSLRTRRATNCAMGPSENEHIISHGVVQTMGGRRHGRETPLS